jgi:hypothetical protein
MRRELTDRAVKAIAPPSTGRVEVFDERQRGLALRVTTKGRKTWTVVWHRDGRVHRLAVGEYPAMGLAQARDEARARFERIAKGLDPDPQRDEATAQPPVLRVRELVEAYLARHAVNKKSGHVDRLVLEKDVLPRWGDWKAEDVRRRDVRALLDTRGGRCRRRSCKHGSRRPSTPPISLLRG